MRVLRVLLAGLVAAFALLVVMFAGALVVLTGLAGAVAQLFRGKSSPAPSRAPRHRPDEIIDVETTKVTDEPPTH